MTACAEVIVVTTQESAVADTAAGSDGATSAW